MSKQGEQKKDLGLTASDANSAGESSMLYAGNIAAACAATNAITRPQVDLSEEEQRRKRLQMNRANAQRNRDRKRIMMDMLQTEKNHLMASNNLLKNQNEQLRQAIEIMKANSKNRGREDTKPTGTTTKKRKIQGVTKIHTTNVISNTPTSQQSNAYRETLVSAMARDLIVQEQLLAQRLNQVPRLLNIGLNLGNPLLTVSPRAFSVEPESSLETSLPGCSRGLLGTNSTILPPTAPVAHQDNISYLQLQGVRNIRSLGLLGVPPVRQDRLFEVPARTALLSSIIPRESRALGNGLVTTIEPSNEESTSTRLRERKDF